LELELLSFRGSTGIASVAGVIVARRVLVKITIARMKRDVFLEVVWRHGDCGRDIDDVVAIVEVAATRL
jgi:Trk K+ transport system NAD-binding subunit